ncbi:MazG family protein [Deinococcus navajonensis]|uniref:MazG family protein n=1 Tax=Deinococcus navajonensis TaxID=309884 RepID=A0ABV8XPL7_9DEIO
MQELLDIMRRLRAPDGCPWDREQTHESLRPYLLEEAAEAADAISTGHSDELRDELGDVLLQVAFHSVIAQESGTFSYEDVERGIVAKLIRRHPHVFADTAVENSAQVVDNWQTIKAAERAGRPRRSSERVPAALGALAREAQAQKLAHLTGDRSALEQALAQAPDSEEGVALVLAAAVAWARSMGLDPEVALRAQTARVLETLDATEAGGG